jgi:NADH dehydrogenase FAD-containing subunit
MCDSWSKLEGGVKVSELNAKGNSMKLSNGKEYTYKSLVLAPGFDHCKGHIKGLEEMAAGHESNNVFVHTIDNK